MADLNSLRMRDLLVVPAQDIVPKIIRQITADGVNVIGVVLGVVVFD